MAQSNASRLLCSALHGLLRKLGAGSGHGGFDDMMEAASGLSGGRFKVQIMTQL